MRRINGRQLVAAGAALMTVLASASTAYAASTDPVDDIPDTSNVTPYIVGGQDATHPWPGMASLQIDHRGDPIWHTCGASLIDPRSVATGSPRKAATDSARHVAASEWVATNAHCVTLQDGSAAGPDLFHLRIGSNDRTSGGVVVGVAAVLPHAAWDWGTGDDPIADIALLRLTRPVSTRGFEIPARLGRPGTTVRMLGWGLTEPDATDVPIALQQLDSRLLPTARCAAGGITAGEICIDNPGGDSGSCYGDSGGPALQRVRGKRWQAIGGTSRGVVDECAVAPSIFTDYTYYRGWMSEVIRTGVVPPAAAGHSTPSTLEPAPRNLLWIGGTR